MITQQKLHHLFTLREDGELIRKVSTSINNKAGDVAGHITNYGYRHVHLYGNTYLAHRLVWMYLHGKFPKGCIDHINGCKSDNRIENLREGTRSKIMQKIIKPQNKNNSGYRGVYQDKKSKQFRATIIFHKHKKHLGYFDTAEKAHEAYLEAKRELHEFCTI